MKPRLWLTPSRYYHVTITEDLFGRLFVTKTWGGRHTRIGSSCSVPILSYQEGETLVMDIEKVREKRGYKESK